MRTRTVSRTAGTPVKSGRSPAHGADAVPTKKEVRALGRRLGAGGGGAGASHVESPEFWARVRAKLAAAAKARRGLRHLTRRELDALMRKLQETNDAE